MLDGRCTTTVMRRRTATYRCSAPNDHTDHYKRQHPHRNSRSYAEPCAHSYTYSGYYASADRHAEFITYRRSDARTNGHAQAYAYHPTHADAYHPAHADAYHPTDA